MRQLLALAVLIGQIAPATAAPCLRGVNLAGAEFGSIPGRLGTDYAYPSAATIRAFAADGMTAIRLPFLWERLQPTLNAPFSAIEVTALDAAVSTAEAAGLSVILDPHNYAHYRGARIGSAAVPMAAFAAFWGRLAERYRDRPAVAFGLMNEPYDMPAPEWRQAAQAAIAAIRASGAKNLVLVPGTAYTGLHSWTEALPVGTNAAAMAGLDDPARNMAYEVHQYFDANSSGEHADCSGAPTLPAAFDRFEAWLRQNDARAVLGEFGVSQRPECLAALRATLARIDADPGHWLGWTYWAAGDWWSPDYMFSVQPTPGRARPQMQVLREAADKTAQCRGGA